MRAAEGRHTFLSVTKQGLAAIVETTGNDATHVIMRGSNAGPNYEASFIADTAAKLRTAGLRPSVMVDCSHGNSQVRSFSSSAAAMCAAVRDRYVCLVAIALTRCTEEARAATRCRRVGREPAGGREPRVDAEQHHGRDDREQPGRGQPEDPGGGSGRSRLRQIGTSAPPQLWADSRRSPTRACTGTSASPRSYADRRRNDTLKALERLREGVRARRKLNGATSGTKDIGVGVASKRAMANGAGAKPFNDLEALRRDRRQAPASN